MKSSDTSLMSYLNQQGFYASDAAIAAYQQATKIYPRSKHTYEGLAISRFMNEEPELEAIETTISIDPEYAEFYYKAGRYERFIGAIAGACRRAVIDRRRSRW